MSLTVQNITTAILHTEIGDFNVLQLDCDGYGSLPINALKQALANNENPLLSNELIQINNGLDRQGDILNFLGLTQNSKSVSIRNKTNITLTTVYNAAPYTSLYRNSDEEAGLFYGIRTQEDYGGYSYLCVINRLVKEAGTADKYELNRFIIPANNATSLVGHDNFDIWSWSSGLFSLAQDGIMFTYDAQVPVTPVDPYSGAGDSDVGGGGGTFDGSSDPVPVPSLPSVGATNTGFISLFVPTQSQLKQVADYLWSPLLDISTFKKIFENPMDCILGLSVVPVSVPTSGSAQITVGNVELSGISLPLASQQYVEIDCGSIPFNDKFFGSYLDQDPYTKMALFVPYSGVHSIKADDVMGKTVNLKYHIDILTGSLVAFLTCGNSVLYEFNGACASNIPVNSMNYASTIENAIRIAVNIGTTVATAGASAPMTGAATAAKGATDGARLFGTAVNMAGSTAEGILSLKPNIDRAGSLGGTTGLMGNQIPYFIITRPRLCKPANQNTFKGYPSFIQVTISDLIGEGYTEFDTVVLAGLYLTDGEKEELKQILESGVYL